MKHLKSHVQIITKPLMRKAGFATPKIISEWPLIVGDYLAQHTTPLKITYPANKGADGTLHIEVVSAQAPIIQQLQPEIIERIAAYLGYKAIVRIKLIHSNKLPPEKNLEKKLSLNHEQAEKLDKMLEGLEDEELKSKLKSIGEHVIQRSER